MIPSPKHFAYGVHKWKRIRCELHPGPDGYDIGMNWTCVNCKAYVRSKAYPSGDTIVAQGVNIDCQTEIIGGVMES